MIELADGTRIVDLARPAQGTRHRVWQGRDAADGSGVIVKVELLDGTLAPERIALEWLTRVGGPSPRLRTAARVAGGEGGEEDRGRLALVLERVAGEPPAGPAGWERLGLRLGALADLPWAGSGLRVEDAAAVDAAHVRRVGELAGAIGAGGPALALATDPLIGAPPPGPRALTITHGDPGPGNFLDDGVAGTLIDWEEASVAPAGLDLARTILIALLGVGAEGFRPGDRDACARAAVRGYLAVVETPPPWSEPELRRGLLIAGVGLAHRRLIRRGAPGVRPVEEAIAALRDALVRRWITGIP